MKRERWITIGEVHSPWFVFEQQGGTPGGFHMTWRGRTHVFQPLQFRKAEHLCWAIERRLRLSHLQWVAMASETKRGLYGGTALRVLVRRLNCRQDADSTVPGAT